MGMTLEGYIDNPMGKKNAVLSNRDMYRDLYTKKFDMILLREGGKIDYSLYTMSNDRYCIHLKIPSEIVPRFYYDVVIEFYTDDNSMRSTKNLTNYFVRFYSNDPSFVFTYAHAFLNNGLFINDLHSKMSNKAMKDVAEEKNPQEIVGYVKSLYFAYLWIKNKGLLNKNLYGSSISYDKLSKNIEHADDKIASRQIEGEKLRHKEKKEKESNKKLSDRLIKQDIKHMVSNIKSTATTKIIGRGSSTKSVKKSKTVKKI